MTQLNQEIGALEIGAAAAGMKDVAQDDRVLEQAAKMGPTLPPTSIPLPGCR